jgi:hypothetical protein
MTGKEWRDVLGYEGMYKVSNTGEVYSEHSGRLLKLRTVSKFYKRAVLSRENKATGHAVHKLVLEAFDRPRPKGMQARHLDGNPSNNKISNLRWGTAKENAEDKRRHGTLPKGEVHGKSKLSCKAVRDIKKNLTLDAVSEFAQKYNVTNTTIMDIYKQKTWGHLRVDNVKTPPPARKGRRCKHCGGCIDHRDLSGKYCDETCKDRYWSKKRSKIAKEQG